MNRVLVVFSDELLSQLDSARGLVSRSAWIRQAVESQLMKEAVAPLVPTDVQRRNRHITPGGVEVSNRSRLTDEEWDAFREVTHAETPEETEILDRMHGITEVSVAPTEERPAPTRQVRGSNPRGGARKGSPSETQSGHVRAAAMGGAPTESPSSNVVGSLSEVLAGIEKRPDGTVMPVGAVAQPKSLIEALRESVKESKAKKPKGCPHPETVFKLGRRLCVKCGEFV